MLYQGELNGTFFIKSNLLPKDFLRANDGTLIFQVVALRADNGEKVFEAPIEDAEEQVMKMAIDENSYEEESLDIYRMEIEAEE